MGFHIVSMAFQYLFAGFQFRYMGFWFESTGFYFVFLPFFHFLAAENDLFALESLFLMSKPPKKRSSRSFANFFSDADILLGNSLSPNILPLMVARGYTQADIEAKLAELQHFQSLHFSTAARKGESMGARDAYMVAKATLRSTYAEQLQLARIAFKNDVGARVALDLAGKRAQGRAAFASQGMIYCENLLDNAGWLTAMAQKGVTEADVQQLLADFKNLFALAEARAGKVGQSLQSTQDRNAVYYSLRTWLGDYKKVARIALRQHPQMVEQLGLKEKS